MELLNATKMPAAYTQGIDKSGRESLVVVAKGTFTIPQDGSQPILAQQQQPIVEADEFTGEAGFSATLYESDFAPFKPRCDVLLNASAYAPNGRPVARMNVGFSVANLKKTIAVVGDRHWTHGAFFIDATRPQPFTQMPISYDLAFGGIDNFHPDENRRDAYMDNPIGRGFHRHTSRDLVANTPLPNLEEPSQEVTSPTGNYRPMSFGAIGRGWPVRAKYAGTYDQQWVDEVFPFLPDDFDSRYFQSAPEDQQCDYLKGGEWVKLLNLTPQGRTTFQLPKLRLSISFFRKRDHDVQTNGVVDTLIVEPDRRAFSVVWRSSLLLKKNIFEVDQILVGEKTKAWWRARKTGKIYYSSLAHIK